MTRHQRRDFYKGMVWYPATLLTDRLTLVMLP
jgi:hypothetical protein